MDKSAETVRILLADDHPILRDGLRRLLEVEPDLRVIYMSSYSESAVIRLGGLGGLGGLDERTAILEKPFTPADLVRRVREVLEPA